MGIFVSHGPSLQNQKGQILVQVMITAVVSGIIMMTLMTMMNAQTRAANAITQKLGANDLQQVMSSAINAGGACSSIIASLGGAATFSSSQVGSNSPPKIPLANIPASSIAGAPVLVEAGTQPSSMTTSLVVKNVQLVVTSGSGAQFKGEIQAVFDETKTIVPLRPASVGVILQTSGGANPVITSCRPDTGAADEAAGTPCTLPGDTVPKGVIMYNWSVNRAQAKWCCQMDVTTQNISYGANNNGGYATFILACKSP